MESIIVEIYVPSISASFDFRLPAKGRVFDIIQEIIRILETTQKNLTFDKANTVFCDLDRNVTLDPNVTIAETGLRDSSRLILV